jgi:hypothetical protein
VKGSHAVAWSGCGGGTPTPIARAAHPERCVEGGEGSAKGRFETFLACRRSFRLVLKRKSRPSISTFPFSVNCRRRGFRSAMLSNPGPLGIVRPVMAAAAHAPYLPFASSAAAAERRDLQHASG